jgi:hypothetical protein
VPRVAEQSQIPEMTNAEIVALRVRVIALENVLISLLATAPDHQLKLIREMADYISPRPGFTPHPLTIRAAEHVIDLVAAQRAFVLTAKVAGANQPETSQNGRFEPLAGGFGGQGWNPLPCLTLVGPPNRLRRSAA